MRRFFLLLLFMLYVTTAGIARAEKADSDKPTNIEADQMAYDDVKQINTFTGNVVLTRGTLIMHAYKLIVTQDPAGYQYGTALAAPGKTTMFRQKRDGGPDLWMEGEAERIEYDGKTEMVKLFSKARLRRLEGSKITDEVEGPFISYDSRAEFFSVHNTPSGETRSGGSRVKVIIQPRTESRGN